MTEHSLANEAKFQWERAVAAETRVVELENELLRNADTYNHEVEALQNTVERERNLRIKVTTLVGETQGERDDLRAGIRALADHMAELELGHDCGWVLNEFFMGIAYLLGEVKE